MLFTGEAFSGYLDNLIEQNVPVLLLMLFSLITKIVRV